MRGCIVTLVAFIWPFSTVSFQMCPQSICIRGCKHTLIAICLTFLHCGLLHAPSKCLLAWMHCRIGYICLTFLRCWFLNVPSNCPYERKLFVCRLSRIGNTYSHLHYMMFQSIQTIYLLGGYDPANMSVSTYLLLLS